MTATHFHKPNDYAMKFTIYQLHLLGEQRYTANAAFVAAHCGVTTPCNRQKIAPAFSAFRPSMDINHYCASLCLALHRHKRTLHGVQLQILG
ncbi:MAG: hypothetical protein HQL48_02100 [Gammaproteobacteria bacterium]|nr:hypothetical protein [Gammaproteobacteria bacterium]